MTKTSDTNTAHTIDPDVYFYKHCPNSVQTMTLRKTQRAVGSRPPRTEYHLLVETGHTPTNDFPKLTEVQAVLMVRTVFEGLRGRPITFLSYGCEEVLNEALGSSVIGRKYNGED